MVYQKTDQNPGFQIPTCGPYPWCGGTRGAIESFPMRHVCPHITLQCSARPHSHAHHEEYGRHGVFSPILNEIQGGTWKTRVDSARCYIEGALSTAILVTKTSQILGRSHDSMCSFCQHVTISLSMGFRVFVWEKLHVDKHPSLKVININ